MSRVELAPGEVRNDDPITQAGKELLAEAQDAVAAAREERDRIVETQNSGGIIRRTLEIIRPSPGAKEQDLTAATAKAEEAKAKQQLLKELVDGGYRFTELPRGVPDGWEDYFYVIKGITPDGKREHLAASQEGDRVDRIVGYRWVNGELDERRGVGSRVMRVAAALHDIYTKAGFSRSSRPQMLLRKPELPQLSR